MKLNLEDISKAVLEYRKLSRLSGREEAGATLLRTELEDGANTDLEERRLSHLMRLESLLSEWQRRGLSITVGTNLEGGANAGLEERRLHVLPDKVGYLACLSGREEV